MENSLHGEIRQLFQAAQRVLLVSHIRPDGDAIGSLLGLGASLRAAGKDVQMVLEDGIPASFHYLPGWREVVRKPSGEFDLIVTLDCSDMLRTGAALSGYRAPDLNIDHHVTNLNFARLNLVDTQAVATAEVLAANLSHWGLPLTIEAAEALLTGIITDTLGFRTSNMSPGAMRIAADLMEAGADLPDLYTRALLQRSYEAVRLWAAGLAHMAREGPLVWTTITLADRQAAGYPGRDDADVINVLSSINDAAIAIIFVEQPNGGVKVSWRAQPGYDVSELALSFGGGGHPAAAGVEIKGEIEQVQEMVIGATRNLFERNEVK
jgi:phosphoesterase RecJ-like protein